MNLTRRSFLKLFGLSVAAGAAPAILPGANLARATALAKEIHPEPIPTLAEAEQTAMDWLSGFGIRSLSLGFGFDRDFTRAHIIQSGLRKPHDLNIEADVLDPEAWVALNEAIKLGEPIRFPVPLGTIFMNDHRKQYRIEGDWCPVSIDTRCAVDSLMNCRLKFIGMNVVTISRERDW